MDKLMPDDDTYTPQEINGVLRHINTEFNPPPYHISLCHYQFDEVIDIKIFAQEKHPTLGLKF